MWGHIVAVKTIQFLQHHSDLFHLISLFAFASVAAA